MHSPVAVGIEHHFLVGRLQHCLFDALVPLRCACGNTIAAIGVSDDAVEWIRPAERQQQHKHTPRIDPTESHIPSNSQFWVGGNANYADAARHFYSSDFDRILAADCHWPEFVRPRLSHHLCRLHSEHPCEWVGVRVAGVAHLAAIAHVLSDRVGPECGEGKQTREGKWNG